MIKKLKKKIKKRLHKRKPKVVMMDAPFGLQVAKYKVEEVMDGFQWMSQDGSTRFLREMEPDHLFYTVRMMLNTMAKFGHWNTVGISRTEANLYIAENHPEHFMKVMALMILRLQMHQERVSPKLTMQFAYLLRTLQSSDRFMKVAKEYYAAPKKIVLPAGARRSSMEMVRWHLHNAGFFDFNDNNDMFDPCDDGSWYLPDDEEPMHGPWGDQ